MSDDEYDEVEDGASPLTAEEIEQVLNWALNVAATVAILHHSGAPDGDEAAIEKLDAFEGTIQRMHDSVPDCIHNIAHVIAQKNIEAAEQEEQMIEQFRDELRDL